MAEYEEYLEFAYGLAEKVGRRFLRPHRTELHLDLDPESLRPSLSLPDQWCIQLTENGLEMTD